MKKIWKIMLAAGVMSLAASLCVGTAAFAATESGLIENGITWKADTDTATVTITGSGQVSESPWLETVNFSGDGKINYVFSDGITGISNIGFPTGSIDVGKGFQSLDTLKQASGPITIYAVPMSPRRIVCICSDIVTDNASFINCRHDFNLLKYIVIVIFVL